MSAGAGRICSICAHPERSDIERRLLAAEPYRKIAGTTGTTPQSLQRHRDNHMTRSVVMAAQQERQDAEQQHDASLLDQAREHHKRALAIMAKAYGSGDLRTALGGIREATRLLELQGKFLGQIAPTTVNVLISAEFKTIQVALLGALEPFPDAKAAVISALERVG